MITREEIGCPHTLWENADGEPCACYECLEARFKHLRAKAQAFLARWGSHDSVLYELTELRRAVAKARQT